MVTEQSDIRQHIIDTANSLILGKGFTAVGLSELLATAGVPKGSFYHYFKSKEAFGEALLEDYFTHYEARLTALLKSSQGSGAERLMQYWQRWLETQSSEGTEGKCLVVKLGSEVSDLSESMRASLERGTRRIIELITQCIQEAQQDGSLSRDLDAADCALTLYNLWLGATVLTKIRHDQTALEAAMRTTRQLLRQAG